VLESKCERLVEISGRTGLRSSYTYICWTKFVGLRHLGSIVLYRDRDGTVHEIDEPLASKVNVEEIARELGLPSYIDTAYPTIQRAVVSVWAAMNAPKLFGDTAQKKGIKEPLSPLLIGGGAVKLLCPSANQPANPFNRSIGDLDFVTPKKEGGKFVFVLSNLSTVAGNLHHYFLTDSDNMFNALRAGTRYRIRVLDKVLNGEAVVKSTDILVEKIELRHTVKFEDEFSRIRENLYTVGPEKLLVSKAQVINELNKKDLGLLEQAGQTFRVLTYPYYRDDYVIIGMEQKDFLDLCAVLYDRVVDTPDQLRLDAGRVARILKGDDKFLLTVRLNLENILNRSDWLKSVGLSERQVSRVHEAVGIVLSALPTVDKKWSKPWWNTDVETPIIT
jgi:hypothetical protein